jgi:hypothetical protein
MMSEWRATISISTAESAPTGIAAPVPVGSAPELSHWKTEPQMSCQAYGTYLHGLNASECAAHGVRPAILAILLKPSNDSGSKRSRNSELQESQA